ncbi:MAG: hypothetical protein L0Z62_41735 [Gemmataceae bacterium]|nr:hypothetical protein [Gemmataceae bacterium]
MNAGTTIPLHVTEEAAAHIAELGMQQEFEKMLEHTRATVPGLREIRVELDDDPSGTMGPGVVIFSHRDNPGPGYDGVDRRWGEWKITTFPPEVCWHFVMISIDEPPADGR